MSKFDDLLKSKSVSPDPAQSPASPIRQRPQPTPPNLGQSSPTLRQEKSGVSIRDSSVKILACLIVLLGLSLLSNLLLYKRGQEFQHQIRALQHDEIRRQDLGDLRDKIESLQGTVQSLYPTIERLSNELDHLDHDVRDFLSKVQKADLGGGKNGLHADPTKAEVGTTPTP
jgi:uncharacterized protein HemX